MLSKGFLAVTDPAVGYLVTRQMFKTVKLAVFWCLAVALCGRLFGASSMELICAASMNFRNEALRELCEISRKKTVLMYLTAFCIISI